MRLKLTFTLALAASATALVAQDKPAAPSFGTDGVVSVPAFKLPPSEFSSPEARAAQAMRARMPANLPTQNPDIAASRAGIDRVLAPQVAQMRARYRVAVAEQTIGGVPVRVFTPQDRPAERRRVLINLHGGAFSVCWDACSMLESVPVAGLGGYRVVSVNYRMAPEARHPAGAEDVEKVYRALLKSYRPQSIGIFGCSAGGSLTAQATALIGQRKLPKPAAIGIFGAGAVRFMAGDSAYIAGYIDGSFPAPSGRGDGLRDLTRGYFDGVAQQDPVVSAALHPAVIGRFPPTLLITGTRAMDLSPAIVTNSALIKARVPATLIVGEGMGHCYIYNVNLPEARDAHQAIVDFFRANLK